MTQDLKRFETVWNWNYFTSITRISVKSVITIREGVKKNLKITNRSVNEEGGGRDQPPARNQILLFFSKEKKMQNVLKRKICILMINYAKNVHLDLLYVLDYFAYIFISSVLFWIFWFRKSAKTGGGERGAENVRDQSVTIRFFTPYLILLH